MKGTIGGTEKTAACPQARRCCVDDCGEPSKWDIHLEMHNPIITGITVAMCARHGDIAHPRHGDIAHPGAPTEG